MLPEAGGQLDGRGIEGAQAPRELDGVPQAHGVVDAEPARRAPRRPGEGDRVLHAAELAEHGLEELLLAQHPAEVAGGIGHLLAPDDLHVVAGADEPERLGTVQLHRAGLAARRGRSSGRRRGWGSRS